MSAPKHILVIFISRCHQKMHYLDDEAVNSHLCSIVPTSRDVHSSAPHVIDPDAKDVLGDRDALERIHAPSYWVFIPYLRLCACANLIVSVLPPIPTFRPRAQVFQPPGVDIAKHDYV